MTARPVSTQELAEETRAMSADQRDFLREAGRSDLYILAKGILNYKDVNPRTHGAFCRYIQEDQKIRRLGLMPRGHLKSTIATISDSIRLALRDPNESRNLICGETATKAEDFLSEIKGHWEKNEILRSLYPELVPAKFAGPGIKWAANAASLNRQSAYKEATWTAVGVGGAIVGAHFTRIKCDDLIGFEASQSPAEMARVIAWVKNIDPLVVDANKDVIDFIGTRWRRHDLYSFIMKRYGGILSVFTREAIENGQVIFPEKHSMALYQNMMTETPDVWFAQYCNNPLAEGGTDFPAGAVRTFWFSADGTEVIGDKDGYEIRWKINELDRVITVDPNGGSPTAPDTAAVIASGISPDDDIFVLETRSGRPSPSGLVDWVFDMGKRWRPRCVGIEKAGQQNTEHYFKQKILEEDFPLRVVPLPTKNRNKIERIRMNLQPLLAARRVYCLSGQTVLRNAIESFPDLTLFDEIDAFAYGPEVWRKPYREEDLEEDRKVLDMMLYTRGRNRRTGY